jgi:quercetin dioxygenase-like cupin family protein
MNAFNALSRLPRLQIWDGVTSRAVNGERGTFAVIELAPRSVVPEHHHDNEQIGILVKGSMRFTIGGDTRALTPGDTWSIPSHVPHAVETGPDGAVAIEVFVPPRVDWATLDTAAPTTPIWP